jgi:hypothetical protein
MGFPSGKVLFKEAVMKEGDLIKRAVVLFPMASYTKPSSVRHARRCWVKTQFALAKQANWVLRDTRKGVGV